MSRQKPELPPCYALVHPGLEEVAGEEIVQDFGGDVKKTGTGFLVFRMPAIDADLLNLRTTEDVFVLAWGTDELTYRAKDLDSIEHWTARKADWTKLLQIHHAVRPKPKGKPSFRLVVQMEGKHGYRRLDARKALARGLAGKIPASWRHVEENAAVEIWLTIHGDRAVCGVRLSDRTMRHRTYKNVHVPASLRPTLAAAMVRLAELQPGQIVLDPMCGAGTLLAEAALAARDAGRRQGQRFPLKLIGGDSDKDAVAAATANLRPLAEARLNLWDAKKLPLHERSVDCILCNPPFGKQLGAPEEIASLYRAAGREWERVLRPGGAAVLLVMDARAMQEAVRSLGWQQRRRVDVRILGQRSTILAYRKRDSHG